MLSTTMLLGILLCIGGSFVLPADTKTVNVFRHDERAVCTSEECNRFAAQIKTNLNPNIDPCVDFYEYACGNWTKNNRRPSRKLIWRVIDNAVKENKRKINEILNSDPQRDDIPPVKILKKWYKACVDTDDMERRGVEPVVSILNGIGGWPMIMSPNEWDENKYNWQDIDDYYARLRGTNLLHDTRVTIYGSNSTELRTLLDVPDMPPATWLLGSEIIDDGSSNETSDGSEDNEEILKFLSVKRKFQKNGKYWQFILRVATEIANATGSSVAKDQLDADIEEVLNFQYKMERISLESDNKAEMTLNDFQKWYNDLGPHGKNAQVNWVNKVINIFKHAGITFDLNANVTIPSTDYFESVAFLLNQTSSRTIANYLHWNFVSSTISKTTKKMAKLVDDVMTDSDLDLSLEDEKDEEAIRLERSETCTDEAKMSDIIAYEYVRKYFNDAAVDVAMKTMDYIQKEIEIDIILSNWADGNFRQWALRKIENIRKNVGYPDWYRNETLMQHYLDGLTIGSTYFENALNHGRYQIQKELRSLRYKDNTEPWIVEPYTINAIYLTKDNSVTVPAANLEPPFFSLKQPNTVNYAQIGFLLAHEMNHAFDYLRYTFDHNGDEIDWPESVRTEYMKEVQCFMDQFDNYTLDGTPTGPQIENYGNLTLEDNMADTMGLKAAFYVHKRRELQKYSEAALPGLEMYNNDQLFFLSFANLLCENIDPMYLVTYAKLDMHAVGRLRVIGSVSNNEEFAEAFKCPLDSPMNPRKKCNIWKH